MALEITEARTMDAFSFPVSVPSAMIERAMPSSSVGE
jgi:hypothetical protein